AVRRPGHTTAATAEPPAARPDAPAPAGSGRQESLHAPPAPETCPNPWRRERCQSASTRVTRLVSDQELRGPYSGRISGRRGEAACAHGSSDTPRCRRL